MAHGGAKIPGDFLLSIGKILEKSSSMFHGIVPRPKHAATLSAAPYGRGERQPRGRLRRGGSGWNLDPCRKREGRGPAGATGRWHLGRAQLALGRCSAGHAAKTQPLDRAVAQATRGKFLERRFGPALAGAAVQAERVPVHEQVGDGFDADRGGHTESMRCDGARPVSLGPGGNPQGSSP